MRYILYLAVVLSLSIVSAIGSERKTDTEGQQTRVDIYLRGWGILADDSRYSNLEAVRKSASIHVSARTTYSVVVRWLRLKEMKTIPTADRTDKRQPKLIVDVSTNGRIASTYIADRDFLYTEDGHMRVPIDCEFKLSVTPKLWSSIFSDDEIKRSWCGY